MTTDTRDDVRGEIVRRIEQLFAARTSDAELHGPDFAALWRLAADQVQGGKLLRPSLTIDVWRALGEGSDYETVLDLAAAVELLHYSFLLHDDVIDGDVRRRRTHNLVGATRARHPDPGSAAALHWGQTCALLAGDLVLAAAHQIFARVDADRDTRLRLLDLLDLTITETVAGEHIDVALSDRVRTSDLATILTMAQQKTAVYTFELPMRLAAILAGADAQVETALAAVARPLGVAFQLQDDLLSVFGDPREHGKDPFSDLREGKETALIVYARMTSAWLSIGPRFGAADLTDQEARMMRDALRECGAERFVRGLVDEQVAVVCTVLAQAVVLPTRLRRVLRGLLTRLEVRSA